MDSSAILAATDQRLTTLSIGFEEEAFDESELAEQVARRFGSEHRRLLLRRDQAWSRLPAFFDALDQPSSDGFNTYCVSAEAAEAGLKVDMSGLGGMSSLAVTRSFRPCPNCWPCADVWARPPGPAPS